MPLIPEMQARALKAAQEAPVEPVEYLVPPLKIITARHAGDCPVTGESFPEGAELTPVAGKWVLATAEVREILTGWTRREPRWSSSLTSLNGAVAIYRAGIDPRTVGYATWLSGGNIQQHRHRVTQAARSMFGPLYSWGGAWPSPFEVEGWVALGFTTGWEAESTAPLFMAAGHDLVEARALLAGEPLTDELRGVLMVEAALRGWKVDGGFITVGVITG